MGLRILLVFGLATLLAGTLGGLSMQPSVGYLPEAPSEWSDGHAPELEQLMRKHCVPFLRQGQGIGLAVAVVTPTNAALMTFGRPALSTASQTRPDTLFELGSISKTFTGLLLARAVDEGKVRLDQPIQELLPADVQLPEQARTVTLKHLTTHSSGFPRMPADWSPIRGLKSVVLGADGYAGYNHTELWADVRKVRLQSKPGTQGCYSNFGMMLLGQLLAMKAGTNYEALVKQAVCRPLGMADTTVHCSDSQRPRAAQGYRALLRYGRFALGLRSAPWFLESDLPGAGGLRSTGADMVKYLQANMRPEEQPIAQALQESHRELFREDERTAYGMNWVRSESPRLQETIVWHDGGTGGFRSFIGFTPDRRVGIVILSNHSVDVDDLAVAILREFKRGASPVDRS